MKYYAIILGTILVMTFSLVDAHGLWVPSSPQKLMEDNNTVFVGTIVDIANVERQYQSQISSNGTIKERVGPETIELEEYTVNVEEFLKNLQDTTILKVLQATVSGVPGGPAKTRGFEIGDRVLFYLPKDEKQTHFLGQYLPESFKIPTQCDAKTVLSQPKITLRNSFEILQDGIAKNDNFTAGIPMKFVLSRDMDDLGGSTLDIAVSIRPYGEDEPVFEKNIHAESELCTWIASAEWKFIPKEGNYRMYISVRENNRSGGDESYTGFSVIPEPKTDIQSNIENIDGQLFKVIGPFSLKRQSDDVINFDGVKFSYPYYPVPVSPGGVQSVDISFEDGTKEYIGTVGPPNPFLKFTDHKDPIGGVRRNSDGMFYFLLSVEPQSVSPLKQFRSGMSSNEIQCKENLTLVQKYDGSPACVTESTKQKLIARGWIERLTALDPNSKEKIVNANNQFAIDFYSKVSQDNSNNLFFSPTSIFTAFAIAYEGAGGNTAKELEDVFGFEPNDVARHKDFAEMQQKLNFKGQNNTLSIANALWLAKDFEPYDDYVDNVSDYYSGRVESVDFTSKEKSLDIINQWIYDNTNGKIKKIFEKLSPDTKLAMTNAIYFKGMWQEPFTKSKTTIAPFHVVDGTTVDVQMMDLKITYLNQAKIPSGIMFELPYEGNMMSMLILLPDEVDGIHELEDLLSAKNIHDWQENYHKIKTHAYVPKFKLETQYELIPPLMDLGVRDAFDSADFSGISSHDLFIYEAVHKAFVEVNEEGTEAAAATGIAMAESAPVPLRVDHPFVFVIQDNETGQILFIGRVMDPTK